MGTPKNVQIPTELFYNVLDLLENIELAGYAEDFQTRIDDIIEQLREKKYRMELRENYSQLVAAYKEQSGEDEQFQKRIEYLKNRKK